MTKAEEYENIILARAHVWEAKMETIQTLQKYRTQLIQELNLFFDDMIQSLRVEEMQNETVNVAGEYELLYPLTAATGFFKGKKPIGVIFQDGSRIDVPTWKKVVETILQNCNKDIYKHKELENLCGKVSGRERVFLANKPDNMRSPIEVDKNIYVETHYDTETLLRIVTTRILTPIQYDYNGIMIAIRKD